MAKPESPYDFRVIRDLRQRDGLTLAAVAGRAGLSVAVISKLERNQASPELDTLHRLARVFGQSATDLLQLAETRTAQVKHASHHTSGAFRFRDVRFATLHALLGEAHTGARLSRPEVHRDDVELIWVLDGRLRVTLPHETHDLAAGDAIQFDAIWEHTYEALADTRFLLLHQTKTKRF